jgi:hypothetical protein
VLRTQVARVFGVESFRRALSRCATRVDGQPLEAQGNGASARGGAVADDTTWAWPTRKRTQRHALAADQLSLAVGQRSEQEGCRGLDGRVLPAPPASPPMRTKRLPSLIGEPPG